jgi:hypothetical protein
MIYDGVHHPGKGRRYVAGQGHRFDLEIDTPFSLFVSRNAANAPDEAISRIRRQQVFTDSAISFDFPYFNGFRYAVAAVRIE